jgi:hypothetical protein
MRFSDSYGATTQATLIQETRGQGSGLLFAIPSKPEAPHTAVRLRLTVTQV